MTLLLRRPLEPDRRFLFDELEGNHSIELLDAARPGLLAPAEALDRLEALDRERGPFDVVLLRGQAVLAEAAERDAFDGRLWSYAMTGRGMADETLRALAERSHRLLCQTEAVAEELREIVPGADGSILVLPPMIPDFGRLPARRAGRGGDLRLVYSGKLTPEYCCLEMVEAFEEMREAHPGSEMHVLGDKIPRPADRPEFHDRARRALRETEGVRWHGALPRAAVRSLLAECDLAISVRDPGVEAAREISTKVLEYGAAGLPVVLNRAPAYERLLGEDYPLFVDGPEEAAGLLAGAARDSRLRAVAAEACEGVSRGFTHGRAAARLAGHLRPQENSDSSDGAVSIPVKESPPLLVTTRFGIGVSDRAWLDHRLVLLSAITAPSLLAQDDQSFYWAVYVDPDLSPEVRFGLEEALAPFGGRAFLQFDRYGTASSLALAQKLGAVGPEGRVLTGRIDDDDAWSTRVVGMVRRRADRWLRGPRETLGVGITFEYGYEWVMYDMLDVDAWQKNGRKVRRRATIRPYHYPFLATSVFVLASLPNRVSALSAGHSRIGRWLAEKDYEVDNVSTERPMWLYCRHKQAGSGIQKSNGASIELTVRDLAVEFGLDEVRVARYLTSADKYGYGVLKRPLEYRANLQKDLRTVKQRFKDPAIGEAERVQLREREAQLATEMSHMAENLVGELDEAREDHDSR
ncbi:MAG: glycosyltransferase [Solirubrobacterales bacterium]